MNIIKKFKKIEINTSKNIKTSIICLHGLGGKCKDFIPIIKKIKIYKNKNIRFIFPQSPRLSIIANNGIVMNAWYNILSKELNNKKEDEIGIRKSQFKIENIINEEIKKGIKSKNIFLIGFSQGASLILQTGIRFLKTLGGLICLSGYLPLKKTIKNEKTKNSIKTPIFIAHGIYDDIINIKYALKLKNILKNNKYNVTLNKYKIQHSICEKEILDVENWIIKKINKNL